MIIRWCHQKTAHSGRNVTLNEIRTGYWMVQGSSAVKEVISRCFTCRRFRGKVGKQIMADLPQDRVKGKYKHLKTIWGSFYMFGKSCYSYRDDQVYGYRLVHPCTLSFHCWTW